MKKQKFSTTRHSLMNNIKSRLANAKDVQQVIAQRTHDYIEALPDDKSQLTPIQKAIFDAAQVNYD